MTRLPLLLLPLLGCAGVNSDTEAALAYIGLDPVMDDILRLGFDGFNAADSANIDTQNADGPVAGTLTVDGQVDQGSSDNKGMRLEAVLEGWSAGAVTTDDVEVEVIYDSEDFLDVDLSLRDIPDGTLSGTLAGSVLMTGDLKGVLTLDLTLDGSIEDDGDGGTQRGDTEITGTATSDYGVFDVNVSL